MQALTYILKQDKIKDSNSLSFLPREDVISELILHAVGKPEISKMLYINYSVIINKV